MSLLGFEQIALMDWCEWCESQLVDCAILPQQSKQSRAVFSKEVHMEGDSLCLPAAVALLRPWLNGLVAICSGPRYREQNSTVPGSVMPVWIWLYMPYTLTTNTLLHRRWHQRGHGPFVPPFHFITHTIKLRVSSSSSSSFLNGFILWDDMTSSLHLHCSTKTTKQ